MMHSLCTRPLAPLEPPLQQHNVRETQLSNLSPRDGQFLLCPENTTHNSWPLYLRLDVILSSPSMSTHTVFRPKTLGVTLESLSDTQDPAKVGGKGQHGSTRAHRSPQSSAQMQLHLKT